MKHNQDTYLDAVDAHVAGRCGVTCREMVEMCPALILMPSGAGGARTVERAISLAIRNGLSPESYAALFIEKFRLETLASGGVDDTHLVAQRNRHLASLAEMCRNDPGWQNGHDGHAYRQSTSDDMTAFRISADTSSRGGGYILSESSGAVDLRAVSVDQMGRIVVPKTADFLPVSFGFDLNEPVTQARRMDEERMSPAFSF